MGAFWKSVIDGNSTASSKRLITLIITGHFIMSAFVILFLVYYVAMYLPKGKVDDSLLAALAGILKYDFYIILTGLGFVTSEDLVRMIMNNPTSAVAAATDPSTKS